MRRYNPSWYCVNTLALIQIPNTRMPFSSDWSWEMQYLSVQRSWSEMKHWTGADLTATKTELVSSTELSWGRWNRELALDRVWQEMTGWYNFDFSIHEWFMSVAVLCAGSRGLGPSENISNLPIRHGHLPFTSPPDSVSLEEQEVAENPDKGPTRESKRRFVPRGYGESFRTWFVCRLRSRDDNISLKRHGDLWIGIYLLKCCSNNFIYIIQFMHRYIFYIIIMHYYEHIVILFIYLLIIKLSSCE